MASRPRHASLTDELRRRIESGDCAVGERLPTELELAHEFNVSRSTVRQALRALEDAQLIDRKQGSGTRVRAQVAPVRYVQTVESEDDILRYASETELEILGPVESVTVADARRLRLGEATAWARLVGIRHDLRAGPPLGVTTVYLRKDLVPNKVTRSRTRTALFTEVAREHGLVVSRIEQEITATLLDEHEAQLLVTTAGMPALAVVRRYYADGIGLFEIGESLHPADRFSYAVRLERDRSGLQ